MKIKNVYQKPQLLSLEEGIVSTEITITFNFGEFNEPVTVKGNVLVQVIGNYVAKVDPIELAKRTEILWIDNEEIPILDNNACVDEDGIKDDINRAMANEATRAAYDIVWQARQHKWCEI